MLPTAVWLCTLSIRASEGCVTVSANSTGTSEASDTADVVEPEAATKIQRQPVASLEHARPRWARFGMHGGLHEHGTAARPRWGGVVSMELLCVQATDHTVWVELPVQTQPRWMWDCTSCVVWSITAQRWSMAILNAPRPEIACA